MSIRSARHCFETAWRQLQEAEKPDPVLEEVIKGLGEMAAGLEDRLDAIKAQLDRMAR